MEVMRELDLEGSIPTVALAKQNEEIFSPEFSEPILLPRNSQSLYLMQRIRDEAHRFALMYHRKLRAKAGIRSVLDEIPGVGPKRKAALIKHFGNPRAIKEASIEEIQRVDGINADLARIIKDAL
jgi:excinuclease ABC subunit C